MPKSHHNGLASFDLARRLVASLIDFTFLIFLDYFFSVILFKNELLSKDFEQRHSIILKYLNPFSINNFNIDFFQNIDLFQIRIVFWLFVLILFVNVILMFSGTIGMRIVGLKIVSRFFAVRLGFSHAFYFALIFVVISMLFSNDLPIFLRTFLGNGLILDLSILQYSSAFAYALWWVGYIMAPVVKFQHGTQSYFEQAAGVMSVASRN